jgi:hypothetical protein
MQSERVWIFLAVGPQVTGIRYGQNKRISELKWFYKGEKAISVFFCTNSKIRFEKGTKLMIGFRFE